ncbi:hypothetical protein VOM14_05455 [Paraburkholderia sp. MPAMCS5]|uniref:hypothetical protein n=1 Tax=Paraburkholderia sp. MPAMCS5 TaxID=3112563 RepID=UPI002E18B729|nr:hypothetical protein [Paraburkholderia sp. MPAMCS5]
MYISIEAVVEVRRIATMIAIPAKVISFCLNGVCADDAPSDPPGHERFDHAIGELSGRLHVMTCA